VTGPVSAPGPRRVLAGGGVSAPEPRRRLADEYLDAGALVAQEFVGQDRLDPTRPTLGALVAEALALAERKGEQRVDARYSALLDRVAAVVRQREDLAVEQERLALAHGEDLDDPSAPHVRWANDLRGQVGAIRSVLDPAEVAEVAGRVQALRAEA
jgi:hypothetical protein